MCIFQPRIFESHCFNRNSTVSIPINNFGASELKNDENFEIIFVCRSTALERHHFTILRPPLSQEENHQPQENVGWLEPLSPSNGVVYHTSTINIELLKHNIPDGDFQLQVLDSNWPNDPIRVAFTSPTRTESLSLITAPDIIGTNIYEFSVWVPPNTIYSNHFFLPTQSFFELVPTQADFRMAQSYFVPSNDVGSHSHFSLGLRQYFEASTNTNTNFENSDQGTASGSQPLKIGRDDSGAREVEDERKEEVLMTVEGRGTPLRGRDDGDGSEARGDDNHKSNVVNVLFVAGGGFDG